MRAIFLADAHLRCPDDENYRKLVDFLDAQTGRLDGLFLLGDIFEFWIGYRHVVFSAYLPLLEKLRALNEAGCSLYYVEGNHDFNLGPFFADTLQCRIITDEAVVEWDGQKLWLCHGDLINKELKGYRLLRAFWRSLPVRILAALLPPDAVWTFGNWLSDKSGKYKATGKRFDPSPLVQPYARHCLNSSDAFICGHFHQPVQHQEEAGTTLVLGDCIDQYSYAELVDGTFTLKTF
jgi:UDP-2,3-diacylglucosamine hydrolase